MSEICNPHGRKRCSECEYVRELEQDIKHYKDITELAVKGLKEIQSITLGANPTRGFLMQNIVDISEKVADTLSKIERLSHE